MREKYGHLWPDEASDLSIELAAFKLGISEEDGGLGRFGHFQNVVDTLWNRPDSPMHFDWNPWAVKMLQALCEHKYLAIAGCASSSKTDSIAMWGIVNFIADPLNTTIIATSTSLKDSRLRIWGRITKYWAAVPGLPGKVVDSVGMIKFQDPETGATSADSGIFLIAGDAKKEKDAVGKMIGFKNRTIVVLADELEELSPAILDACMGNLDAANENFQLVGTSNPGSYYSPFGQLAKPKDGWGSITADHTEWETEYGYCVRFDGELSPNVLAGEVIYPYMITKETIEEKKRVLGENSPQYWRMYRGFWCPTGTAAGLFTEADIMQSDAESRKVNWRGTPDRVAFLDTAFTEDGDRAIVQFGICGTADDGKKVLLLDKGYTHIKSDITRKEEPLNFQIAKQFKDLCLENGVRISNAGVDSTGGGGPFSDILSVVWGTGFYRCYFGGSPSLRPASSADPRPGTEAYYDRVSEIWGTGVELVRTGQLKGLYFDLIQELTARLYETVKRATGSAIAVEAKRKMRKRSGKSPDIADAALGLVDLCRERLGLDSVEGESLSYGESGATTWDVLLSQSDRIHGDGPSDFAAAAEREIERRIFASSGFIPM